MGTWTIVLVVVSMDLFIGSLVIMGLGNSIKQVSSLQDLVGCSQYFNHEIVIHPCFQLVVTLPKKNWL